MLAEAAAFAVAPKPLVLLLLDAADECAADADFVAAFPPDFTEEGALTPDVSMFPTRLMAWFKSWKIPIKRQQELPLTIEYGNDAIFHCGKLRMRIGSWVGVLLLDL